MIRLWACYANIPCFPQSAKDSSERQKQKDRDSERLFFAKPENKKAKKVKIQRLQFKLNTVEIKELKQNLSVKHFMHSLRPDDSLQK